MDHGGGVEGGEWPVPSALFKPVRPNQFKLPPLDVWLKMAPCDQKRLFKKFRLVDAKQRSLICALRQELSAERNARALLQVGASVAYRLEVDTPSDKGHFPREIGVGHCDGDRRRVDADWVVLSRTTMVFNVRVVRVGLDGQHSTVDAYLGSESASDALPLTVTLCNDVGVKIEDPFLATNASPQSSKNALTFDMTTNTTRVALVVRATSYFLRNMNKSGDKVRLKFETTFDKKHLSFETRPFVLTIRPATGKNVEEMWKPDIIHTFCDECACCGEQLGTTRRQHEPSVSTSDYS